MKEFAALWARIYSYLTDSNDEDKKAKGTKRCAIKRKRKSEDYKICLKTTQFENKINQLEKNKINTKSLRENQKEFTKTIT